MSLGVVSGEEGQWVMGEHAIFGQKLLNAQDGVGMLINHPS